MRLNSISEICVTLKNERAWAGTLQALWNMFRRFIMFNVFRMRFVRDSENCLAVRILGMTFSYYKGEPVLMYNDPKFTEITRKREFGESIRSKEEQ